MSVNPLDIIAAPAPELPQASVFAVLAREYALEGALKPLVSESAVRAHRMSQAAVSENTLKPGLGIAYALIAIACFRRLVTRSGESSMISQSMERRDNG